MDAARRVAFTQERCVVTQPSPDQDPTRFAEHGDQELALEFLEGLVRYQSHKAAVSKAFGIIATWPNCTRAWVLLIHTLGKLGEIDRALVVAETALQKVADPWWIFFAIGSVHRKIRQTAKAMAYYRKAMELHPGFEEASTNAASLLIEQGEAEDARAIATEAMILNPGSGILTFTVGRAYRALDNKEQARQHFMKAIALVPDLVPAYLALAEVERALGLMVRADRTGQRARILAPNTVTSHNNAGLALYEIGDYEQAMAAFKRAIALEPDDAVLYKNLSFLYSTMGLMDLAVDAEARAVALVPDRAFAMTNRMLTPHAARAADYEWFFQN